MNPELWRLLTTVPTSMPPWTIATSVIRSCEIPSLWQIFKHLWQYVLGLFCFSIVFNKLWYNLYAFVQSFIAVNGQIFKTQSVHLVTLIATISYVHLNLIKYLLYKTIDPLASATRNYSKQTPHSSLRRSSQIRQTEQFFVILKTISTTRAQSYKDFTAYTIFQAFWLATQFFSMGHPRPLFRLFSVFLKQTIQNLQQNNVKNVHPVSCARIWTHGLLIMSLLLYSAYQCSRPNTQIF